MTKEIGTYHRSRPMNDDKLKELEGWCNDNPCSLHIADVALTVIDRYRQLEKDVARLEKSNDMLTEQRNEDWVRADKAGEASTELLAALLRIHGEACCPEDLDYDIAIQQLKLINKISVDVHDKHKGKSGLSMSIDKKREDKVINRLK